MSFYFSKQESKRFNDIELLRSQGCKLCPLYVSNAICKDMQPTGSTKPDILILGQGPGEEEDIKGRPFVGRSGRFLQACFTKEQWDRTRQSNITRTRTPEDREPTFEEIEACRRSVENDIVLYKPRAVFAFGGLATNWFLNQQMAPSINTWRGHHFPSQINGYNFWVFPMLHPAYLLRGAMHLEHVFKLDITNAYHFLKRNIEPIVLDTKTIFDDCHDLYTISDIRKSLVLLNKEASVSVDIETKGERPYHPNTRILSISIGTKNYSIAFPWKHSKFNWSSEDFRTLRTLVLSFLLNKKQKKIAHNASFELEWLIYEFNSPKLASAGWEDTMSDSYCLGFGGNTKESEGGEEKLFKGLLSLDNLCRIHFGFYLKALSNIDRANLDRAPIKDVLRYNAGDSKMTHWLREVMNQEIVYEGLENIRNEHDRRIPTIVLMERKGLCYSKSKSQEFNENYTSKLAHIQRDIYGHQDIIEYISKYKSFNISTPANVISFFERKGFNVKKLVKKGKEMKEVKSSDDEILKAISHPIAKLILDYREFYKLKGTYVDPFILGTDNYTITPDNLVHCNYTSHFTTSGRLSCKNINAQNFPKRKNKEVRNIIIPTEGHVMVSCDYGQIEARVIAMLSRDKYFVDALWNNLDVHAEWARIIAKMYPARIGGNLEKFLENKALFKAFRDIVKNKFVFPSFFGAAPRSLAGYMEIPEIEIRKIHSLFWGPKYFIGIKKWQESLYEFYEKNGYVETFTGRRRYAYLISGEIINFPVQGFAADIMIDAMNRLSEYALESGKDQFQSVISLHDDLTFYIPETSLKEDINTIVRAMLSPKFSVINVPLTVEVSTGPAWGSLKEYGTFSSVDLNTN